MPTDSDDEDSWFNSNYVLTDHEEPCGPSHRSFCLNGGICYVIPTIPSPFCSFHAYCVPENMSEGHFLEVKWQSRVKDCRGLTCHEIPKYEFCLHTRVNRAGFYGCLSPKVIIGEGEPVHGCIENYTGARCEEVFLPSSSIQIRSDLFTAFVALAVLGTLIIGALYFLCRISHHVVRSLNSTKNQLQLISQTAAAPTTRHLNKPSQTSSSVESLVDATFSYQLTTNTETPSRNCPAVIPQNRRATFRGPAPSSVTSAWWRRAALAPTTVMENTEEISQ